MLQTLWRLSHACEDGGGKRYNGETLEVTYKGLHIAAVLNLTLDEAVEFSRAVPRGAKPA